MAKTKLIKDVYVGKGKSRSGRRRYNAGKQVEFLGFDAEDHVWVRIDGKAYSVPADAVSSDVR